MNSRILPTLTFMLYYHYHRFSLLSDHRFDLIDHSVKVRPLFKLHDEFERLFYIIGNQTIGLRTKEVFL